MTIELNGLLQDLVKINSVTLREQKICTFLEKELSAGNFNVQKQEIGNDGRFNLFIEKGRGAKILFYGHLDTVPVINDDEWQSDPFSPTIKGDRLYGLGASDMKGGISAFLEAMSSVDTPTKAFLAVDEEAISEGAWDAVNQKSAFFKGVELIVSGEPSFGLGLNGVTNGRTGRCVYEVEFEGRSEHIIKYKEAVDAIEKFVKFGNRLYKSRNSMFNSPDTVVQVRKIQAESVGMSVCGEALAEIEVILGAEDSIETVRQKLQDLTEDKIKLKPRKTPYLSGYYFDDFPYKHNISKIIQEKTGMRMDLHKRKSVGDDNVLATLGIPLITWGSDGNNEHRPNEYVNLKSLDTLKNMYRELLQSI